MWYRATSACRQPGVAPTRAQSPPHPAQAASADDESFSRKPCPPVSQSVSQRPAPPCQ
ncbi:hypothetical protein T484DRAFT_1977828 [Baffinella frigidus]|nr:hypothetical protein T484DRAFT_1977828 [Cryptophyta sp. CCMP2293]